jgi:anti-anti-sigma factor
MIEGTRQLAGDWWATFGTFEGWLVVRLHPPGEVFTETLGLAEAIWDEIARTPYRRVAMEMNDVAFLPSSLMGVGVRLHKRLSMEGGELRIVGLRPACRDAWHACRLNMVLPIYDDLLAAVA